MKFLVTFLLFAASLAGAQMCPPGSVDMLAYVAPWYGSLNGHYNVVYPATGKFYWVKSNTGYPWDVDQFDRNFIYQSITEVNWTNPSAYKIFKSAMPWMPRCINTAAPGKRSSILLTPTQSTFDIHSSCANYVTKNLGYVANEIWFTPPTTFILVYRYNCDSTFGTCNSKETFQFQPAGLTVWTYYTLSNGIWIKQNQTIHTTLTVGFTQPIHPCWTD